MKRFVTRDQHGLSIVTTDGHIPANAVCEAKDSWIYDELSETNGVVFHDPARKHHKDAVKRREHIKKRFIGIKVKSLRLVLPVVYIIIGLLIAKMKLV